jgi:hypothetical protein
VVRSYRIQGSVPKASDDTDFAGRLEGLGHQRDHFKATLERYEGSLRRRRNWRCLRDIAKKYDLGQEARIWQRLLQAILAGRFERDGRSQVLFLTSSFLASRLSQRLTRPLIEHMIELFGTDIDEKSTERSPIVLNCLRHCWIPDALYRQFADDLKRIDEPPSLATRKTAVPTDLDNCTDERGAPPIYHYDQIKGEAFRQFKQRGLPSRDGDKGWQTRTDLEKVIEDFCDTLYERRPAKSTLQGYAKRAIKDWQADKSAK